MSRPKIRFVLEELKLEVQRSNQLLAAVRTRGLPFFQVEQIAELSYLKSYLAWETFLEESFIRLLQGAHTLSGRQAPRHANPISLDHARNLLIGLEKGGRYSDWTRRSKVTDRANLLFKDGKPFVGPLQAAARDLDDMAMLRDCIAHRSEFVRKNFGKVVQRRLGVAQRMHPGRFLLRTRPGTTENHLEFFSHMIIVVAEQVLA